MGSSQSKLNSRYIILILPESITLPLKNSVNSIIDRVKGLSSSFKMYQIIMRVEIHMTKALNNIILQKQILFMYSNNYMFLCDLNIQVLHVDSLGLVLVFLTEDTLKHSSKRYRSQLDISPHQMKLQVPKMGLNLIKFLEKQLLWKSTISTAYCQSYWLFLKKLRVRSYC